MKKLGLFALEGVANKLEHPSHHEKHKRINPQPVNENASKKQRKRKQNCWYPQGVAYAVYRMLMTSGILRNPLFVSSTAKHGDLIIHGPGENW